MYVTRVNMKRLSFKLDLNMLKFGIVTAFTYIYVYVHEQYLYTFNKERYFYAFDWYKYKFVETIQFYKENTIFYLVVYIITCLPFGRLRMHVINTILYRRCTT